MSQSKQQTQTVEPGGQAAVPINFDPVAVRIDNNNNNLTASILWFWIYPDTGIAPTSDDKTLEPGERETLPPPPPQAGANGSVRVQTFVLYNNGPAPVEYTWE